MPPKGTTRSRSPRGGRLALLTAALTIGVLGTTAFVAWPHVQAWYEFLQKFEPLGDNVQGYPEYRHRKSGIVFVRLPGGTFSMGSSANEREKVLQRMSWSGCGEMEFRRFEEGLGDEGPIHIVRLTPFLIAKYEVGPREFSRSGEPKGGFSRADDLPMGSVSWHECREFCLAAGLRLPTEAQWEYACRGEADKTRPVRDDIDAVAWFGENSGRRPHAVGTKAPNGFGLHDMLGNVWEWCEDWYRSDFYSSRAAELVDPACLTAGTSTTPHVLRGGSFDSSDLECRPSNRQAVSGSGYPPPFESLPSRRAPSRGDVGFRPVYWPLP